MSIIIKRSTGWSGSASKIQIKVNGDKVSNVTHNQYVEVELPDGKAHLKVSQFGIKSNEIEVKDGDIVEIVQTKWHRMSFPMSLPIILLVSFLTNFIIKYLQYRFIVLISMGVLFIISLFLIDGFYLKVIEKESQ